MNPSENEIRKVLGHLDPPEGFAERVFSRTAQANALSKPAAPFRSRLVASVAIIAIAVILAAGVGLLITRCASACSIGGGSSDVTRSPENSMMLSSLREISGRDITAKDCLLKYKRKGRLLAVASIFRDLASLQAEVKMERESTWRAG